MILGLEYVFLRYFGRGRWKWAAQAETAVLSLLGFLLGMGIVRHATILACFGKCAVKLSGTAVIVAWAFLLHGSGERPGFWNPLRCRLVAAGAFFWGLYLALLGFRIAPWALDVLFFVFALLVWLGRRRGLFFIVALGILAASAARATGSEWTIIIFNIAWIAALLLGGARRIESWIETRVPRRSRKNTEKSRASRILRAAGMAAATALAAAFALYAIGSILFVTGPGQRRTRLLAYAPAAPAQDPAALSPLAARLRRHVVFLAEEIGERPASQPERQARARDYVVRRLRAAGYAPKVLPYSSEWMPQVGNGTPFYNVEAVLSGSAGAGEVFIVGAHYDTTLGTPGADDNASGVAVLLEAARLMRSKGTSAEIRFVAFAAEEPPAFGTQNMGSSR
ncbi:MAG: M28 family peptidase, partial [Elusimicrobiota bacterium]